jgi:hypothetical protein
VSRRLVQDRLPALIDFTDGRALPVLSVKMPQPG